MHAQYLYDAAGQRVKKLVRKQGGQVEVTHYLDGIFEHHRWGPGTSAGANNHVHVMDDKQRIALVRLGDAHPDDTGPAVQFHLADHLGSSNVVLDDSGALTNREEYTPYGETSFGSFTRKRYRFTGKERDEESGLVLSGARYLSTSTTRWINCDPAGPAGGANLYCYAHRNPLSYTDPTGLQPKTVTGVIEGVDNYSPPMGKGDPNLMRDQHGEWILFNPDTGGYLKWQGDNGWKEDTSQYIRVSSKDRQRPTPLAEAYEGFRRRHSEHSRQVLENIDEALSRVTSDNPSLLLAYYNHYASHKLADKEAAGDIGGTTHGDTEIRSDLLDLSSKHLVSTDLRILLGTSLIHEFVHAFQGATPNDVDEDKAYGIELAFSWRLGDQKRVGYIEKRYSQLSGDEQTRKEQATIITETLFDVIDRKNSSFSSIKGITSDQARVLMVNYITNQPSGYEPQLTRLAAEIARMRRN